MLNHAQPIANEFDSYMQDRAQRLGYKVRFLAPDAPYALRGPARFALLAFTDVLPQERADDFAARGGMQTCHDQGHFIAWAGEPGALVQVNVYRREMCHGGDGGDGGGRIGVRTFAEEFFSDAHGRSLPLDPFREYLAWLASTPQAADAADAAMLALAIRLPEPRELLLVRQPSVAAAHAWLRRNS